ncbi:MAG TPA: iron ABC transporter permease [Candidatus Ligilactobacillus excrementipullorum]|nr:iron ABC transporter permease [Candidatus Ligilactobacillus excrementipullorum]
MKNEITTEQVFAERHQRQIARRLRLSLLLVVLLCLSSFALLYGQTIYSVSEVGQVLSGKFVAGASFTILELRLPRLLAALLAGMSFGIADLVFQTLLHNPLANPDILGISSGSSCAVVICILVFHTSQTVRIIAAVGAGIGTVLLLFGLSNKQSLAATRLVIIGLGLQAFYNAVISYFTVNGDQRDLPEALRWLNGSLDGISLNQLPLLAGALVLLLPVVMYFGQRLQLLSLGDEIARSLGVNVGQTKIILLGTTVILTALATAVTGPIAFVSFLAGPLTNKIMGHAGNNALAAGVFGACLVIAADLVGQYAFIYRFPVGVITGLIGAPYLIIQLIHLSKRGAG